MEAVRRTCLHYKANVVNFCFPDNGTSIGALIGHVFRYYVYSLKKYLDSASAFPLSVIEVSLNIRKMCTKVYEHVRS